MITKLHYIKLLEQTRKLIKINSTSLTNNVCYFELKRVIRSLNWNVKFGRKQLINKLSPRTQDFIDGFYPKDILKIV